MSAKFELSANAGNTLQVIQQMTGAIDATGKAAEGAVASTKKLNAEAQRIKESIDPQERLNRKYAEMNQMIAAGVLTQSQAIAKGIELRQVMHAASAEGKAQAAAEIAATRAKEQAMKAATAAKMESAKREAEIEKARADAIRRTIAAAKQAQEETKKQLALGDRIKASLETPTEHYKRQVLELGRALRQGTIDKETFVRGVRKYREELDAATNSGKKAFGDSALASLKSYAAGALGIGAAVGLIRQEIDIIAQRAEKRAQLAMTTADAEAGLRKVVATDKDRDSMISGAKQIASVRNLPEAQVYQAATAAYGAIGNVPGSLAALEEASRQSRDPSAIPEIAAGIGFVMQSTGIKSAQEASGLLNQVLAGSPIADAKVPQAYAKVAASFMSPTAGGSAATAGAFLASLSQASADTEGDRSRTGAIDFIDKSKEYFQKNGRKFGITNAASDEVDERLALLMSNPELARDFITKTTFEAPVRGGMASLFLTETGRKAYADNLSSMQNSGARVAAAEDTAKFITSGKLQATKTLNNIVSSASDAFELGKEGLLTQESYDKLIGMVADQWGGPFANTRARAYYGATTGLGGVDTLEAIHMLRSNRPTGTDEASTQMAAKFDVMIDQLRGLRQEQRSKVTTQQE